MSEPFLGEIRIFAGNFAPRGWAFCQGQLLAISQNTALFSLLGTTYGGNGQTTFALPDLRGRSPVHWGSGPGLPPVSLGEQGGSETVTLIASQMPAHSHAVRASSELANAIAVDNGLPGAKVRGGLDIYTASGSPVALAAGTVSNTGATQPHSNLQPALALSLIIAVEGIFPSRN